MMKDGVVAFLATLGYICQGEDEWMIDFAIDKVTRHIQQVCNLGEVPQGLQPVVVERVCGTFLQMKKASGQLDDCFDVSGVSGVQAGDTNVSFDTSQSLATQLDGLIARLQCSGEGDLVCYRKVRW